MVVNNVTEWFDDERGGVSYVGAGLPVVDDITGANPILPGTVFHTRNIHASSNLAWQMTINVYDGPVVAGSMRWHFVMPANTHLDIIGLRSMRFHSTIIFRPRTTASTLFVHIGGVLRYDS